MSRHNQHHAHCEHAMAYCGHCDVAYCSKCSREWGVHSSWWPYYPATTTTTNAPSTYDTTVLTPGNTIVEYHANHTGAGV